ncbi:hypothetical protein Tco_0168694 [Tanacetum coccineum]
MRQLSSLLFSLSSSPLSLQEPLTKAFWSLFLGGFGHSPISLLWKRVGAYALHDKAVMNCGIKYRALLTAQQELPTVIFFTVDEAYNQILDTWDTALQGSRITSSNDENITRITCVKRYNFIGRSAWDDGGGEALDRIYECLDVMDASTAEKLAATTKDFSENAYCFEWMDKENNSLYFVTKSASDSECHLKYKDNNALLKNKNKQEIVIPCNHCLQSTHNTTRAIINDRTATSLTCFSPEARDFVHACNEVVNEIEHKDLVPSPRHILSMTLVQEDDEVELLLCKALEDN